jgi:hypothetical protein
MINIKRKNFYWLVNPVITLWSKNMVSGMLAPFAQSPCTKLDLGGDMKHSPPPTKSSATGKELYIAELFELDKSKVPSRLADAQER